jgi:hypothetical protein
MDEIELILDWAEDNTWFDTTFVYSLRDQYEAKGRLSDAQIAALENIIDRFNIE